MKETNSAIMATQSDRFIAFDQKQIIVDFTAFDSEWDLVNIDVFADV